MTKLEALQQLAEKVEAGDEAATVAGYAECFPASLRDNVCGAYTGDMNAALSLHNAVLPEWGFCVWTGGKGDWAAQVSIAPKGKPRRTHGATDPGNASRAALLAILRALIAKEQQNSGNGQSFT